MALFSRQIQVVRNAICVSVLCEHGFEGSRQIRVAERLPQMVWAAEGVRPLEPVRWILPRAGQMGFGQATFWSFDAVHPGAFRWVLAKGGSRSLSLSAEQSTHLGLGMLTSGASKNEGVSIRVWRVYTSLAAHVEHPVSLSAGEANILRRTRGAGTFRACPADGRTTGSLAVIPMPNGTDERDSLTSPAERLHILGPRG